MREWEGGRGRERGGRERERERCGETLIQENWSGVPGPTALLQLVERGKEGGGERGGRGKER